MELTARYGDVIDPHHRDDGIDIWDAGVIKAIF